MTRINTLDVSLLLDEWLIAEYRELKRIPNKMRAGKYLSGWVPEDYRMGFGHERFFLDKMLYLKIRHDELRDEMWARFGKEYDITVEVYDLPEYTLRDWSPEHRDHVVNVGRLRERFSERKREYHYHGKVVTEDDFLKLYGEYYDRS